MEYSGAVPAMRNIPHFCVPGIENRLPKKIKPDRRATTVQCSPWSFLLSLCFLLIISSLNQKASKSSASSTPQSPACCCWLHSKLFPSQQVADVHATLQMGFLETTAIFWGDSAAAQGRAAQSAFIKGYLLFQAALLAVSGEPRTSPWSEGFLPGACVQTLTFPSYPASNPLQDRRGIHFPHSFRNSWALDKYAHSVETPAKRWE